MFMMIIKFLFHVIKTIDAATIVKLPIEFNITSNVKLQHFYLKGHSFSSSIFMAYMTFLTFYSLCFITKKVNNQRVTLGEIRKLYCEENYCFATRDPRIFCICLMVHWSVNLTEYPQKLYASFLVKLTPQ